MAAVLTPEVLADPVMLTRALVDIESVSGDEKEIADAVEAALEALPHLKVERLGNTVAARTALGRDQRVVLAGHLDTVPLAGNFPSHTTEVDGKQIMWGCGTSDMKSGTALALHLAATVTARCRARAVPLFMSEVPQPHMICLPSASVVWDGKLPASGTVSR